jgi:phage terminase large subunit GpA-like protein
MTDGFEATHREWMRGCIDALTDRMEVVTPSAWAEAKRYLPPQQSPMPGYYRFKVAPYLQEILDCLSVESPVRQLSCMKGSQLGFTVGVLENAIGYYIEHVRNAPMMLVTADLDMARDRVSGNIAPMLQYSGMRDLIKSADELGARKTGKTERRIEWMGGGYLLPFGANSANKMRNWSIQVLLRDEVDGWPLRVGRDGDPLNLTERRTSGYESHRKIVDISTPTIEEHSKIKKLFLLGDQRHYFVRCVKCGHAQTLRWRRTDPNTGAITGIVWDMEDGRLVPGSVRYLCEACSHPHTNDDKTQLLSPEHGAEWRPTAKPANPHHRSYHLSALYSPVGMQTWEACVQRWLEAWDVENDRPRDNEALQVFYNNILGETFVLRGEKLRFEQVSAHRRQAYGYGSIPNAFAREYAGSPIYLLTCAVDVHAKELPVAVIGWARERRPFLIHYERLGDGEGDTEQLDDPATWGALRTLIESREFASDDGRPYPIDLTVIDCGYRTDHVYNFCADYVAGVFPIKGQELASKRSIAREFSPYQTPNGQQAFNVTVDLYKDRLSAALRRSWDGQSLQPAGHFNAPLDTTDAQLKELTRETKRERIEQTTGKRIGWEWHRPSGAKNELWDLLVYNAAAFDLIAWNTCREQLGMDEVDWAEFWALLEKDFAK